jgi:hypothetical protein
VGLGGSLVARWRRLMVIASAAVVDRDRGGERLHCKIIKGVGGVA